jgi:simple sugar transport system substrate-binding protein
MQFNQAINTKPDGIAIMGHPGDKPYQRLIKKSVNMGIIVTSQNVPLPENEKRYKHKGFGYVGQDLFQSGESLAQAAIKKANVEKGDRVAVWGFLKIEGRGERTKGALYPLQKKELIIDYLEITNESNKDASKMTEEVKGYLRSHPDVRIIIFDHGGITAMSQTYLKAAGKKPGEIFVAGFDLAPASVKAIESGFLGVVLDQQPFLQGYMPVLQIYLTKKYGFAGMHIDTGAALIDKTNISAIKHLAVKGLR